MDTNRMRIFAGRIVLAGTPNAAISVPLPSQVRRAQMAEAGATSNHWKQQKGENA